MREVIMQYSGEGEDLHDLKKVGELIRCKACRFSDWYMTGSGETFCYCMEHGTSGHAENDYCSYGEKIHEED